MPSMFFVQYLGSKILVFDLTTQVFDIKITGCNLLTEYRWFAADYIVRYFSVLILKVANKQTKNKTQKWMELSLIQHGVKSEAQESQTRLSICNHDDGFSLEENILYSFLMVYNICCQVEHELDVNEVISIRDYEKTPRVFKSLPNGLPLKMI